jgi:hypothetical protein
VIALTREGWILAGFAMLFFTALVVSACGWLLVWRTRQRHDEPIAPEGEHATYLGPANPLR